MDDPTNQNFAFHGLRLSPMSVLDPPLLINALDINDQLDPAVAPYIPPPAAHHYHAAHSHNVVASPSHFHFPSMSPPSAHARTPAALYSSDPIQHQHQHLSHNPPWHLLLADFNDPAPPSTGTSSSSNSNNEIHLRDKVDMITSLTDRRLHREFARFAIYRHIHEAIERARNAVWRDVVFA